jgi:hypothetical protein
MNVVADSDALSGEDMYVLIDLTETADCYAPAANKSAALEDLGATATCGQPRRNLLDRQHLPIE